MSEKKETLLLCAVNLVDRKFWQRRKKISMNMTEVARLLLGLRAAGWSEKEINDFVLYIESGEEQYKPKPREMKSE